MHTLYRKAALCWVVCSLNTVWCGWCFALKSHLPFVGQQVVVSGAALICSGGIVVPGGLGEMLLSVLLKVSQTDHRHFCTMCSVSTQYAKDQIRPVHCLIIANIVIVNTEKGLSWPDPFSSQYKLDHHQMNVRSNVIQLTVMSCFHRKRQWIQTLVAVVERQQRASVTEMPYRTVNIHDALAN